jgi:hypothetical protein
MSQRAVTVVIRRVRATELQRIVVPNSAACRAAFHPCSRYLSGRATTPMLAIVAPLVIEGTAQT